MSFLFTGALIDIISVFKENYCYLAWFSVAVVLSPSFLEKDYYFIIGDRLSFSIKVIFHLLIFLASQSLHIHGSVLCSADHLLKFNAAAN